MLNELDIARNNAISELSRFYKDKLYFEMDRLEGAQYISSWEVGGIMVKLCSDNIFDSSVPTFIKEFVPRL